MLWLADYTVGQADTAIEVPPGWSRSQIIARQYSDKASVAGVSGTIDDSRILNEWTTSTPVPPTPPEDFTIMDAATKKYFDDKFAEVNQGFSTTIYGDSRVDLPSDPPDTHRWNIQGLFKKVEELQKSIDDLGPGNHEVIVTKIEELKNLITNANPTVP
jgi:hypothetical protein